MRAITWHGVEDVRVDEVADPALEDPTDALVRVTRSGICGSDLHLYHGRIPGMLPGAVLGHEYAGIVDEAGDAVATVRPGDRVVGPFHVACGACRPCGRGDHHQCDDGAILGYGMAFGDLAGSQAEYVRIPHADVNLWVMPDGLDDERALFCGDVLGTAFGAVKNAGLQAGETCAVIGCGPVGLLAVQSALALGAGRVLAIDLVHERTELAERFGAVPIHSGSVNPVSRVNELTDGEGADAVIEAVGGPATLELAFDLVRGAGRIAAVGVTSEETFDFPLTSSLTRDIQFRIGLANIHRDIEETLRLVADGRIDPEPLISHQLPLEEGPDGYRLFAERSATKVVLEIG